MKLNEMIDCRHIKESESKNGMNGEVEELQKIISDRWDEIWNIVQTRNARESLFSEGDRLLAVFPDNCRL